MPTTSPDNLWSPDNSDNFEDLVPDLATMQGSVQAALSSRAIRTYKWADTAARNAQTGMTAGDTGYQIDTDTGYRYNGSSWVVTDEDTGWIDVALNAGWTLTSPGEPCRYRRLNRVVYILGRASRTSGTEPAFVLPAGFRPIQQLVFLAEANGSPVRASIPTNGYIFSTIPAVVSAMSFSSAPSFIAA